MENVAFEDLHPHLLEATRGWFLLNQRLFELQERLTPIRPEWNGRMDARRLGLNALASLCTGSPLALFNVLYTLGKDSSLKEFARLADIKADRDAALQGYRHMTMFTMGGAILFFQFHVEYLFQNLWRALGKEEDRTFLRLSENLLSCLKLASQERMNRLRILAFTRNSLHNNGIHSGTDWTCKIASIHATDLGPLRMSGTYEFRRHQSVGCTLTSTLGMFCGVLDVVVDVLQSDGISQMVGPIPALEQAE